MVGIEDNNGDAISCIVLMIDSLANDSNVMVTLKTVHADECDIFSHMKEQGVDNESINEHEATSTEARHHLYSCTCDAIIESTFARGDGETLLVEFRLSDAKKNHPWLDDPRQTKEMVELASDDQLAPLLEDMKPVFRKNYGHRLNKNVMTFRPNSETLN
tara:strand:- start:687 stop:1166 length:480 start_codon:yes stop_codon:yes gene_type:complete